MLALLIPPPVPNRNHLELLLKVDCKSAYKFVIRILITQEYSRTLTGSLPFGGSVGVVIPLREPFKQNGLLSERVSSQTVLEAENT